MTARATRSGSTSAPSRRAPCSSTARTAARSARAVYAVRERRDRRAAPGSGRGRRARAGLGAPGSRATTSAAFRRRGARACSPRPASTRRRSSGSASTSPPARCSRRSPTGRRSASSTELRRDPHAWVKLWKHHAAQPEADRINAVAAERGEPWLAALRRQDLVRVVLREGAADPRRGAGGLRAADRLIEAADWVVWQLTGVETPQRCTAGYKAMWSKRDGFPSRRLLRRARPALRARRRREDVARASLPLGGARRRRSSERAAAWTGLRAGTPVAVANVDAHVSAPAVDGHRAGDARDDHGHEHLPPPARRRARAIVEGMCGVVEDGIVPGSSGTRRASRRVGDIFAWFVETPCRRDHERATRVACTTCSRRRRRCGRARAACSRSTGGTATARCSSTPTCAGCSSG